jgi:hypothetical protein
MGVRCGALRSGAGWSATRHQIEIHPLISMEVISTPRASQAAHLPGSPLAVLLPAPGVESEGETAVTNPKGDEDKPHTREEGESLREAKRPKLDMRGLGRAMAARKEALLAAQGKAARVDPR